MTQTGGLELRAKARKSKTTSAIEINIAVMPAEAQEPS
jgi:hypothetical protein